MCEQTLIFKENRLFLILQCELFAYICCGYFTHFFYNNQFMLRHCFKQMLLVFFASLMLVQPTGAGVLRIVGFEGLPRTAQLFINEMYPTGEVETVSSEQTLFARVYKVRLKGGTQLEFDSDGEWLEVVSEDGDVVSEIVPCPIFCQLKLVYPEFKICKIERACKGYDLVLNNGVEIFFDEEYEAVG